MDSETRQPTIVGDLNSEAGEFGFTVVGPFGEHHIRFWGDVPAGAPVESALAVALLPAMVAGGELSIPGPLSPQLRRSLPDLQAILKSIASASVLVDRTLEGIELSERPGEVTSTTADSDNRGVAAFFSGGVDSWWSLLSDSEITDLIYVHGFDIPIDDSDASSAVERRLSDAAKRAGKRLRVIRSDLRAYLDPVVTWEIAHGPGLAAVALLISPNCERVLIPATTTYAEPAPRGSHPLHDPLWSIEGCRIEHHGGYLTRVKKIEQIAGHQDALNVLRVCWRHVDRYNCGHCDKCLRTMTTLSILGVLDHCPTFPDSLDLEAIRALRFHDPHLPIWWGENLRLAQDRGAPGELVAAIETCLASNPPPPDIPHLQQNLAAAESKNAELASELGRVRGSLSWKLTKPLRRAGGAARRVNRGAS